MPTVSIITPLFNKGRYVDATMRSVLEQTFTEWEMIVVDNGSSDDGPDIVRQVADERIRYTSISERGPSVARNKGIGVAGGEWLLFLDADDLIEPDFLMRQVITARKNPGADIVVSPWEDFPDGNPSLRTPRTPAAMRAGTGERDLLDYAIAFTPWAPLAALVRANALTPDLMWPQELDKFLAEDTTFWFRLINCRKVAYSQATGALYRQQAQGCRTRIDDGLRWFEGNHAAVRANLAFIDRIGLAVTDGQCESLMRLYSELYVNARRTGDRRAAREAVSFARHWLLERTRRGTGVSRTLTLRRIMGIPAYAQISGWAKRWTRAVRRERAG